jgi:alpha-galactosidase
MRKCIISIKFVFTICLLIVTFNNVSYSQTDKVILTPKPGPQPKINSAKVFGVRPGSPIQYTIAATGDRPMTCSAKGLPNGVTLDAKTGRLSGSLKKEGIYKIKLSAHNALGKAERELRLVVGDDIALTPPMGFNTYGGWGPSVSAKNIRDGADALVKTGLVNHGYTFVNIDDGWQGKRGGKYNAIQSNEKFPDMKGLCDYIHSLGLKVGIYSTPWTSSYEGFVGGSSENENGEWVRPNPPRSGTGKFGKYTFEEADAKQWEEWGIDYCKYDWAMDSLHRVEGMLQALRKTNRDIVYEISNSAPLKQAEQFTSKANMTRTTNDLTDVWEKTQLPDKDMQKWALGIRDLWLSHQKWQEFNRPGHWNMPCPLRVGMLGGWDLKPMRPSRLTPNEQYSHISLWCLWSAPIIIGCPPERLDEFTLGLLSNDEVIEIDQDPLGMQAKTVKVEKGEVLAKNMEDETLAVGLFNPGEEPQTVTVTWEALGLKGKQIVRDVWRQKDLGTFEQSFSSEIPSHGVVLARIKPVAL